MIIVKLRAGLGNQLFMYALGKHLALKNNTTLKFDISWWDQTNRNRPRNPSICNYDVSGELATPEDIKSVLRPASVFMSLKQPVNPTEYKLSKLHELPNIGNQSLREYYSDSASKQTNEDTTSVDRSSNLADPVMNFGKKRIEIIGTEIFRRFPKTIGNLTNYYRDIEGTPANDSRSWAHRRTFSHNVLNIQGDAYLEGYWQSPKYFEAIADTIRSDFSLTCPLTGTDAELAEEISETQSVSIHIRRGDRIAYTENAASEQWGDTPKEYIDKAVSYVTERVSEPHFFVFSDSSDWTQEHVDLDYPTTFVTHNDGSTDHLDLELMKRCDHNIISGSTFSWWAAWLNDSDKMIVTAPDPWTASTNKGELRRWDHIPNQWKVLEYQ